MDEMVKAGNEPAMMPTVNTSSTVIAAVIQEILTPILAGMTELIGKNTEAVQYLAAQQKIQTDRMEALERQIRLNTLVTTAQVRYINDAIRKRARDILSKIKLENDKKAVTALSAAIRKAILSRYGVPALHDIPKHEYSVVMQQVDIWNDLLIVRDIAKQARFRAQAAR